MALPLSYHWHSLLYRKTSTVLTVLVIAAVVGVFAWMVGFAGTLRDSLSMASDDHKLIILKQGATAESSSALPFAEYTKLAQVRGLARDPQSGEAMLSPEMVVQVSLPRVRDRGSTNANVAVRGVTEIAFKVHPNVTPIGRIFQPGTRELIVGVTAAKQFEGLAIGSTLDLGYGSDRSYRVVGFFSAEGAPVESEIWGYLPSLMDSYARNMYSSAALRLGPGVSPEEAIQQIKGPPIELNPQTETEYWKEQSKLIQVYLKVAYVLVAVMCVAAVLSIANTMFAAVAGRTREFAMLRTIGYSRSQILLGVVWEAIMLSFIGGLLGCIACWAWLQIIGNTKDVFGANTFTTMAFEIHLTLPIALFALGAVCVVGVFGAMVPARRAARLQVVEALREA